MFFSIRDVELGFCDRTLVFLNPFILLGLYVHKYLRFLLTYEYGVCPTYPKFPLYCQPRMQKRRGKYRFQYPYLAKYITGKCQVIK